MHDTHTTRRPRYLLGVTIGDPSGIGPEIILKSLQMGELDGALCVLYGSREIFEQVDRQLAAQDDTYQPMRQNFLNVEHIEEVCFEAVEPRHVVIVDVACDIDGISEVSAGEPLAAGAHVQLLALERAIEDAKSGAISAIVTAPWTKELFRLIDHPATGHTEVLAKAFDAPHHVMMLAGPRLRVALTTVHVPVRDIHTTLTRARLEQTIRTTAQDLRRWFGVTRPRVAVCALNPHAGEHGVMGSEEDDFIRPTIEALRAEFGDAVELTGPHPADTLFARYKRDAAPHDAVVCMYHDQALIPLKLLHFGESANITLGLPILRTSVDHGTAYDIAGQGIADASSMRYAIELAIELLDQSKPTSDDHVAPALLQGVRAT